MMNSVESKPPHQPTSALHPLEPFNGQILVVTGATHPVGQALSLALAKRGAHMVVLSRDHNRLERYDDIYYQHTARRATLVKIDADDEKQINHLGPALAERFGRCDGLIWAASHHGYDGLRPVIDTTITQWRETWHMHVLAPWRMIRTLHPLWRQSSSPRCYMALPHPLVNDIIPLDRFLSDPMEPFLAPYYASLAGMQQLIRAFIADQAHRSFSMEAYMVPSNSTSSIEAIVRTCLDYWLQKDNHHDIQPSFAPAI